MLTIKLPASKVLDRIEIIKSSNEYYTYTAKNQSRLGELYWMLNFIDSDQLVLVDEELFEFLGF